MSTAESYDLRAATSPDAVAALRPQWEQLPWQEINAQLDWFLLAHDARSTLVRPHVLVAEREGAVEGMLMAQVEYARPVPSAGPLRRLPRQKVAVVVPGGLAGSREAGVALMRKLFSLTRSDGVRAICLRHADVDGEAHACLRSAVARALVVPPRTPARHWFIDLPDDYETYVASLSSNLRKGRRKEARALERKYGSSLELVRHRDGSTADELLADLEAVAANSYQREQGVGFRADRYGTRVRRGLELGLCRAWVLRIDGRPVAFELGWLFAGTYRGVWIAFDREFRGDAVGGYVEQRVLAELCADPDVTVYDHGILDYDYKRRLSNRFIVDADIWAFAAHPAGLTARAVRTGYELARPLAARIRARRG